MKDVITASVVAKICWECGWLEAERMPISRSAVKSMSRCHVATSVGRSVSVCT